MRPVPAIRFEVNWGEICADARAVAIETGMSIEQAVRVLPIGKYLRLVRADEEIIDAPQDASALPAGLAWADRQEKMD